MKIFWNFWANNFCRKLKKTRKFSQILKVPSVFSRTSQNFLKKQFLIFFWKKHKVLCNIESFKNHPPTTLSPAPRLPEATRTLPQATKGCHWLPLPKFSKDFAFSRTSIKFSFSWMSRIISKRTEKCKRSNTSAICWFWMYQSEKGKTRQDLRNVL